MPMNHEINGLNRQFTKAVTCIIITRLGISKSDTNNSIMVSDICYTAFWGDSESFSYLLPLYQSIDIDTSSCSKAPLSFTHARTHVAWWCPCPQLHFYTNAILFANCPRILGTSSIKCWVNKLTLTSWRRAGKSHFFSIYTVYIFGWQQMHEVKGKIQDFWPFVTKNSHQPHGRLLHFLDLVGWSGEAAAAAWSTM